MTGRQPLPHESRARRIREAVASVIQRLRLRLSKSSSSESVDKKDSMPELKDPEDHQRVLSPIHLPLPPIYRPYTKAFQPRPTRGTIRLPQPVVKASTDPLQPPMVRNFTPRRQPPVKRRRGIAVDQRHRNSQSPRGWVYPITYREDPTSPPPSSTHRVTDIEEFFRPFSPIN